MRPMTLDVIAVAPNAEIERAGLLPESWIEGQRFEVAPPGFQNIGEVAREGCEGREPIGTVREVRKGAKANGGSLADRGNAPGAIAPYAPIC